MKECVGDGDAGETEMGRCLCARAGWGGGGYEWEMSCSDVTSAVSRQDAGMCHTDEGRGRRGEKSKFTMKWFISPPPHTKLLLYLWTLQRLSNMDAEPRC